MKFSDLLGEPEPEENPATEPEPIEVFAPVPMPDTATPPADEPDGLPAPLPPHEADPTIAAVRVVSPPVNPPLEPAPAAPAGGRSGLAELNVHQPVPAPPADAPSVLDQLAGLDEVVDDLLPPRRSRR